jgi:hypothetical protein
MCEAYAKSLAAFQKSKRKKAVAASEHDQRVRRDQQIQRGHGGRGSVAGNIIPSHAQAYTGGGGHSNANQGTPVYDVVRHARGLPTIS